MSISSESVTTRRGLAAGLSANPYLLLILAIMMWAGHSVVSRMAVDQISPAMLTSMRWLISASVMLCFRAGDLRQYWPVLKPRLGYLVAMGAVGYTGYNTLLYHAAHSKTAINLNIINSALPALIFVGALLIYGQRMRLLQWIGMLVSMSGVLLTAAKGDLGHLMDLRFNQGDLLFFGATVIFAAYSVLLRSKPQVPSLVFFAALAPAAAVSSALLLGVEISLGEFFWPTLKGWLVLVYVAVFPSLLAQILFIRAIELIGAARAGLFVNLMPVFGATLAVLILGEQLAVYHVLAMVLVMGGILLAEWRRR